MFGQLVWLGTFPTAEEAGRAYDKACIRLRPHEPPPNFPREDYMDKDGKVRGLFGRHGFYGPLAAGMGAAQGNAGAGRTGAFQLPQAAQVMVTPGEDAVLQGGAWRPRVHAAGAQHLPAGPCTEQDGSAALCHAASDRAAPPYIAPPKSSSPTSPT